MTANRKIVQLTLIFIGLFLILVTYFLYPKINKNKHLQEETFKNSITETKDDEKNLFENVEYRGLYRINKPFTIQSEKAYILTENPEIIYMTNMLVTLYMNNGRIIIVTSDKGRYNKETYDCFFEDNVKATDEKTIILAKNLDLLASEDSAVIYNNVVLTSDKGSLRADKIDYDLETKHYKISMFNDKKVKIKLIK